MLTTVEEVENRLQRSLDSEDEEYVTEHIEKASAHIESFIGRSVLSAQHTEMFDPYRPVIWLRYWPVTEVTAVKVEGEAIDLAEIFWYSLGKLFRYRGGRVVGWGSRLPQSLEVTYQGGFTEQDHELELTHLSSVCAEVVARAFRLAEEEAATPAGASGEVQSVSLAGSDTVTYSTGQSAFRSLPSDLIGRFMGLSDAERFELEPYRGIGIG